jgi:hypothetical protein
MCPNAFTAPSRALSISERSRTSASNATPVPPPLAIEATVSSAASSWMSTTATAAPWDASRSAVARPMPEPAPVIIAIFPEWSKLMTLPPSPAEP